MSHGSGVNNWLLTILLVFQKEKDREEGRALEEAPRGPWVRSQEEEASWGIQNCTRASLHQGKNSKKYCFLYFINLKRETPETSGF